MGSCRYLQMNELQFIESLSKKIKTGKDVIKGIGDDAAVIRHRKRTYMLFASDMLIEGVHFLKNTSPYSVGWKAVAVNVSDIAAMGGVPKYVVISIGIPEKRKKQLAKIISGAQAVCRKCGVSIVGGDTNASKSLIVDVSIIGEVKAGELTRRDSARVSDLIFLTGRLGKSWISQMRFLPRLKESRTLVSKFRINSMIDISDGFCIDLTRLCGASNVGANIYKSLIPSFPNKCDGKKILSQGEQFELLFTLSRGEAKRLVAYARRYKYPPVTLIGEITSRREGLHLICERGKPKKIEPLGYRHF